MGLGMLAIGAIWLWSVRRSSQAPGNAELRESSVVPVPSTPAAEASHAEKRAAAGEARPSAAERAPTVERAEWGISPLEPLTVRTVAPLSIRAADFDDVPEMELPMLAHPDPLDVTQDLGTVRAGSAVPSMQPGGAAHIPTLASPTISAQPLVAPPQSTLPPRPRSSPESSDRADAAAPANSSERQKIVALRVCAVGEARWSGAALMSTLEQHGLAYGRYQVYHRKHIDGRSVFCVASLIEPGTFDAARMAEDQFRGVSMFAVLPGPLEPLQTVDALFATARNLAKELSGTVQDAKGIPFSPQRVAALREDVARFQAQLG
jgi:cell division protein ZipA